MTMNRLLTLLSMTLLALAPRPALSQVAGAEGNSEELLPDATRAVLIPYAGQVTAVVSLQLFQSAGSERYAWVLPVPATPTVASADPAVFDELDLISSPLAVVGDAGSAALEQEGGAGCGDGGGGAATPGQRLVRGVEVVEHAVIDAKDVFVVEAAGGEELAHWLEVRGFTPPADLAAVMQGYVARGWSFVVAVYDGAQATAPRLALALSYAASADGSLPYATRALQLTPSLVAYLPVTLHVVALQRAVITNHEATPLPQLAPDGWRTHQDYRALLERALLSDARVAWVIEAARPYARRDIGQNSALWQLLLGLELVVDAESQLVQITRLSTLCTRLGAAASPDLTLRLDPGAEIISNVVSVPASALARQLPPPRGSWGLALWLGLLWLFVRRRGLDRAR